MRVQSGYSMGTVGEEGGGGSMCSNVKRYIKCTVEVQWERRREEEEGPCAVMLRGTARVQ